VPFKKYLPYLTLLLWVLPIVLLRSPDQSLMAHDEGIYATQARSILQTGDWLAPQWGGKYYFDRTIGIQWLIAICYLLFGIHEGTARLPSAIALILSTLLTYEIGKRLLNARLAWLGAAIFSVIPLVAQYGRLATQDIVLVGIELVGIWALLQSEKSRPWAFLTGLMFGAGFMIKGFMIIPTTIALLPYLVTQFRRHRHLLNPWLYGGWATGMVFPIAWLWAATQKYGSDPINQLFGKFFHLKQQTYQGAGITYYFWNIPANGFPWVFFALGGLWLIFRSDKIRALVKSNQARSLLVGFPVVLFIELTLFGTRTHYYPLQLMPWIGLLAAIALEQLAKLYQQRQWTRGLVGLNLAIGGFAIVLLSIAAKRELIAQTFSLAWRAPVLNSIAIVILVVGLGWLSLPVIWLLRHQVGLWQSAKQWVAAWLLTSWVAIAMFHLTGLWGNYAPELKAFLQRSQVADVLKSETIHFVVKADDLSRNGRKEYLLLNFYTPNPGLPRRSPKRLIPKEFAWIDPNFAKTLNLNYQIIDTFNGWILGERVP
jgi:4-amino-4-deoxy-L-arabinose transferase-like glycosyltransferase